MWRQSIPHIATENERMLSLPCGSKGLLKHDNWLPSDRKVAPKYHHLPRTIVVSQSLSHPIRVCLSVCLFTSFLSSVATHGPLIGLQSSNLLRVPIVSYYRAALTLIGRKRFRYQMESTEHELTGHSCPIFLQPLAVEWNNVFQQARSFANNSNFTATFFPSSFAPQ